MIRGTTIVRRLAGCVACLLTAAPPLALALVLGPIEARSALYEPLDAWIPVQDARRSDLEGLNVVLGSPAQFELAGVARLPHLNLLEFMVVKGGEGGDYIHVRTDEPIIEPSLTFLVDVDWPRGRTVRGYRLHLATAVGRAADAGASRRAVPQTQTQSEPETETGASRTPPASSGTDYGPIRESETLWSIASRLRPDTSVSVQRMMLAILEANPSAFVVMNVNGLHAGATLRIPGRDEIGPDNLPAAIAEVERQHSAWSQYRKRGRAAPTPSTPTAASPRDPAKEPGGRVEVVSPETATGVTAREEGADVETLRKELALTTEEADVGRRENNELKLRLAEAEDHIKELNRLVELKNEEIAALQADLRAMSEAGPEPVPTPAEEETKPVAVPAQEEPKPVLEPAEAEPAPSAPSVEEEPKPAAAPEVTEPTPVPSPAEMEPKPAMVAEAEPKPLPFGLGTLPVNPVFLVGGAGLLLLLLGVLALLRRRRASTGEEDALGVEDALESDEASSPDDDNLLFELEAVAAELADELDESPSRSSRAVPGAAGGESAPSGSPTIGVARSGPESLVEQRVAELWRDEDDAATERALLAQADADDDASEITFDIDALTGDDSDLSQRDGETSDDFDIGDLADLAVELETDSEDPNRTADESIGSHDPIFGRRERGTTDSGIPGSEAAADAPDSSGLDSRFPDDGQDDARLATLDDLESLDAEPDPAGTTGEGADWSTDPATQRSVDFEPGPDPAGTTGEGADWSTDPATQRSVDFEPGPDGDTDDLGPTPQASLDEPTDGGETEAYSLEDFGEDEVQTKIDLAQVYMEMGDTESARGFLEAVLAEGDDEQRDTAREMLAKLA